MLVFAVAALRVRLVIQEFHVLIIPSVKQVGVATMVTMSASAFCFA